MTSHPSRSYTLETSTARPTLCVPSNAIVRTLCVATVVSCPRARARFLVSLCRRWRCSASPRRLRLRVNDFLLSVTFLASPFPCPVLALYFGLAAWVQPSHDALPRPSSVSGANLVLTRRLLSPPLFPLRYASFGAMTIHANGLTCGFNWQCTADVIGYAVMITAGLSVHDNDGFLPDIISLLTRCYCYWETQ